MDSEPVATTEKFRAGMLRFNESFYELTSLHDIKTIVANNSEHAKHQMALLSIGLYEIAIPERMTYSQFLGGADVEKWRGSNLRDG